MPDGRKIAVIRVRGRSGVQEKHNDTMRLLGLTRVNHCVVVDANPYTRGMIAACKDYITWGEINKETLAALVEKRGMLSGDVRLSEAYLKAKGFGSFGEFAEKMLGGAADADALEMKCVFRLHPPRKGYDTTKKVFPYGALGNRGAEINELIKRMM